MKKIGLIIPYFGEVPNYFALFLKSCSYNPEIDWLIITDNEMESPYPNVHFYHWTFEELKKHISKRLEITSPIPAPYKLCDYRPAYGEIFSEYLTDYDIWGHCDIDLIYGDITKYIKQAPLDDYDRIFTFGHLTLYRNTKEVNRYYQLNGEKDTSFYYCIQFPEPMYFDEHGMNRLLDQHHIPQYHHPTFADILPQIPHFKNRTFQKDKNYPRQSFIWQEGKIFKIWRTGKTTNKQEYSYIHLQKRTFPPIEEKLLKLSAYVITPHGFVSMDDPSLPTKRKPNYPHAFAYYKKRYSNITPKKITRKLQLTLMNNSQKRKIKINEKGT